MSALNALWTRGRSSVRRATRPAVSTAIVVGIGPSLSPAYIRKIPTL